MTGSPLTFHHHGLAVQAPNDAFTFLTGLGYSLGEALFDPLQRVNGQRERYRALCQSQVYIYFCRGMTFAYFTMAVTALWVDLDQLLGIGRGLGVAGGLGAFVGLTIVGAVALLVGDLVWTAVVRGAAALRPMGWNLTERTVGLACMILLTLAVNSLFRGPPEFVYRAF